jgi:RNA polymerase sigma factor for flagellar operon FliA
LTSLCPAPETIPALDIDQRTALILENMPRVRWIAARIHQRLPLHVSLEDLVSIGVLGLIDAVDRFDPRAGVKLQTFAEHRIRGAILDSIAELDGMPAHKRPKMRELDQAQSQAEQRLGRAATSEEVAEELGIPVSEYHRRAFELQRITLSSLADAIENESGSVALADTIADRSQMLASDLLEERERWNLIAEGIEALSPVERRVVESYFLRGMPLREIASELDLHITRISQIKIQAVERLRAHLGGRTAYQGGKCAESIA